MEFLLTTTYNASTWEYKFDTKSHMNSKVKMSIAAK